ncbi:unnamed protein product [Mytilus edulis]|uniref:Uncharacterized protein n=1 Tax=Mytilus edulis TaxID=6550 RepID=A0A8S3UTI2_MYTED|nr:unnamed protein product [Mytilus edulis]
MMKTIKAAHVERKSWKQELFKFLRQFQLLFNRTHVTKLPEVHKLNITNKQMDENARQNDESEKCKMKKQFDERNHAKPSNIEITFYLFSFVKSDKHSKYYSSTRSNDNSYINNKDDRHRGGTSEITEAYSRTEPKEWQPSSSTDSQCAIPTSSRDTPKRKKTGQQPVLKKKNDRQSHAAGRDDIELYNGFTKVFVTRWYLQCRHGYSFCLSFCVNIRKVCFILLNFSVGVNHLYDCGLVVNPEFSVLGATADGKLCSNGTTEIIEIKARMLLETSKLKRQLSQLNGVNADIVAPSLQRNIIEATSFRSRIVNQLRSTYSTISEDEDVYSCDYEDIREVSNDSGFLEPEPITSLSPASDVIKKVLLKSLQRLDVGKSTEYVKQFFQ